jgi:hypothetical protein
MAWPYRGWLRADGRNRCSNDVYFIDTLQEIAVSPVTLSTRKTWSRTIFDTQEWLNAWSRSTAEKAVACDSREPPMYAVEWSPFWGGYVVDAEMGPLWDRPLLTISTLYSFYGPAYLLDDPGAVRAALDRGVAQADEWNTAGILIPNLTEDAALAWAEICPPDASVRLDIAYHRAVGAGEDPVVGSVNKHVRTDWRRRWRRATEHGLRLVEEAQPDGVRIDEVIGLANSSALRHGWPAVYDRTTADEVLAIPGARLLRADYGGQTAAGFIALEHERTLYLWAGGTHPTLLREVSPYLFILYEVLAMGAERGWDRIEFGRGNDAFKRKYGFEGTDTWSLWYARRPAEAGLYRAQLATLHTRLSQAYGVAPRLLGEPDAAASPAVAA